MLQACHQHSICSDEFVAISAIDGFDQDCIAVYFDHDHYLFVALLGLGGKLSVWLENTVSHMSFMRVNTSRTFDWVSSCVDHH